MKYKLYECIKLTVAVRWYYAVYTNVRRIRQGIALGRPIVKCTHREIHYSVHANNNLA